MKKAFTLIETMVVLSILAIIAILSYSFFGSVMRGASVAAQATELVRQVELIEAAYHGYVQAEGEIPNWGGSSDIAAFKAYVVQNNIIREWPKPDPSWQNKDVACSSSYSPDNASVGWRVTYNNLAGPEVGEDAVIQIWCLTAELCAEINERYSDVGVDLTQSPSQSWLHGGMLCGEASTADNDFQFQSVIAIH